MTLLSRWWRSQRQEWAVKTYQFCPRIFKNSLICYANLLFKVVASDSFALDYSHLEMPRLELPTENYSVNAPRVAIRAGNLNSRYNATMWHIPTSVHKFMNSYFFNRRRRKRRDPSQSQEGKPERPHDFNLPHIPHHYSTAASLAASSLSDRYSYDTAASTMASNTSSVCSGYYNSSDVSSDHAEQVTAHHQQSGHQHHTRTHTSPIQSVSSEIDIKNGENMQSISSPHNAGSEGSAVDISTNAINQHHRYSLSHETAQPTHIAREQNSNISAAASAIHPNVRAGGSHNNGGYQSPTQTQSGYEPTRYPFYNTTNPSYYPQPASLNYSMTGGSNVDGHGHFPHHYSPNNSQANAFNFSVNNLITRVPKV